VPDDRVVAKDVIVVLDQSGSMQGEKWDQAREAAAYILEHLNPADRFNLILFSTGWRDYSRSLESRDSARGAVDWINTQYAEGGTDINAALLAALDRADVERPTTVLFLTDGLATEGEIEADVILDNLHAAARPNVSIFAFGVGDDVDTFLLDSIVRDHHGASTYVRPGQRINEEVASLYNKISAPVLTDISLDFGGVTVEDSYPGTLPDLFAGEQLTIVGRYRGEAENISVTLSGTVSGQRQTFTYSGLDFPGRAGGEPFIARLWATRRIGDLLNSIRLNGENDELVQSIVSLSVRYGIITPYTSFLIEEDDILSQAGRDRAVQQFGQAAETLADNVTGASAVDAAAASGSMRAAEAPMAVPQSTPSPAPTNTGRGGSGGVPAGPAEQEMQNAGRQIRTVNDRTFILLDGVWTDTAFAPDTMQTEPVAFLSDAYFALLDAHPELTEYFALGERVIVVLDGVAYEVTAA
jgi:Ca-activated chloride channel family protein